VEESHDDMATRVQRWIEDTGYPLEMRVVAAVNNAGFPPGWWHEANFSYRDINSGTHREGDLRLGVRTLGEIDVDVTVCIECKNTSAPWVVFRQPAIELVFHAVPLFNFSMGAGATMAFSEQHYRQLDGYRRELGVRLGSVMPRHRRPGFAVAEAFKKPRDKDTANSAVRQAAAAARGLCNDRTESGDTLGPTLAMYVPVVITTSQLYDSSLEESSGQVALSAVERSSVSVIDGAGHETSVTVVNESAIHSLFADCLPLLDHLREFDMVAAGRRVVESTNEVRLKWRLR
jgi:hypothetical protein